MVNRWRKYIKNLKNIERENAFLKQNLSYLLKKQYSGLFNSNSTTSKSNSINEYEFNVYSQNGEDGILLFILSKIGVHNFTIIEFGGSDGQQCNSANLLLNYNWNSLLIEGNSDKVKNGIQYYENKKITQPQLKFISEFITAENINVLFNRNGYEGEIDILSIDIDGNDYHVLKNITTINPRIIVAEYNASLGPTKNLTMPYIKDFTYKSLEKTGFYFGASLKAFENLGKQKGYTLVGTDSMGVNAFFIRNDLMNDAFKVRTSEECYHENLKCKEAGGHEKAFEKISHLEFITPQ